MAVWFLGLLIGALVAVHMTRPYLENRKISSARFFKDLPRVKKGQPRLRLSNPLLSPLFFIRFAVLLLLMAALVSTHFKFGTGHSESIGMWILADTSASMSTLQNRLPRMATAKEEINRVINQVKDKTRNNDLCMKLSWFDLELHDLVETRHAGTVRQFAEKLNYRALGTDLNLIRSVLKLPEKDSECTVSHVVVITDQPAPEWVSDQNIRVIWRDISTIEDNIGFTGIRPSRNPLTGLVQKVVVTARAFGTPPANAHLTVTGPDGNTVLSPGSNWDNNTWRGTFSPGIPGQYELRLWPGGAYHFDDHAIINISEGQAIRVDWQLEEHDIPRQFGWIQDRINPHFRIISQDKTMDQSPTLVIGKGYNHMPGPQNEILYFDETSPLLDDLNFDIVESLGMYDVKVPGDFEPVLNTVGGHTWIARRKNPPAVFIPNLPTYTDDNMGRLSTTIFFNAVRWLLHERSLPPLYTLTTPENPSPHGTRLALHEDEGNTAKPSNSFGQADNIQPVESGGRTKPVWPLFLAGAVLFFASERFLTVYGGGKWH
ncbi:MAG: hypothetical protein GY749_38495 [Desulfobacteraceae bacterium]|nr:hypothetical protein [Desulfobacteraceae bacterium]